MEKERLIDIDFWIFAVIAGGLMLLFSLLPLFDDSQFYFLTEEREMVEFYLPFLIHMALFIGVILYRIIPTAIWPPALLSVFPKYFVKVYKAMAGSSSGADVWTTIAFLFELVGLIFVLIAIKRNGEKKNAYITEMIAFIILGIAFLVQFSYIFINTDIFIGTAETYYKFVLWNSIAYSFEYAVLILLLIGMLKKKNIGSK